MSILAPLVPAVLMALSAIVFLAVGARLDNLDDDAPSALLALLGGAVLMAMQAGLWIWFGLGLSGADFLTLNP